MTAGLDAYAPFVGRATIEELRLLGERLRGRRVQHINSTAVGGGVAEILNRLVPLLLELGINTRWDVIRGGDEFYAVTKAIHNALHGQPVTLSEHDVAVYRETTEQNLRTLALSDDIVFIHDPQPAGLIAGRAPGSHWIWRCHIDLSAPVPSVWEFLRPTVERYDAAVFSAPQFSRTLPIDQVLIAPSIDPLADKNRELDARTIESIVTSLGLDPGRPLVTQVSRFDRLKDPLGVIEAYRLAKKYNDCQLLLVGGSATDDPEGQAVLTECRDRAADDRDIHVVELPPTANIEINAVQRASTVLVQKSLREGFGLTVAEALWKAKPVIAGAVGGIPLQITHKYSGVLTHTIEGTAYWIKQLLNAPDFARHLGENGREHVRHNFLLTRHLRDYMLLFLYLGHLGQSVITLD
ncbi:MAG: glycosyltransferase [Deltaproteobacteria bacterium]|nr:MAG: glycosyltransferase [Deltaproteobacteria bacterium]TMA77714.1 MAG: glycosyltransferase [Deltaproteobacteria bacterium]TMB21191.1 MAG: glycosyltransferase [Deltaproteobacteria bacterium]